MALMRRNWYLVVAMVGCAALGVYGALGNDRAEASKSSLASKGVVVAERDDSSPPERVRMTESEQARSFIEKHEARLAEDPKSPDAPGLLSAMGNLYRQKLGDYERAAQCYERLLYDYPTWEGTRRAYIQLVACYEALKDEDNLRNTYKRMMEVFPPDSQEHIYAKTQLGL